MPYRILFVSSLHHPQALREARVASPDAPLLFPPSMSQHFWERAFRRRGHTLDVFFRNLPGGTLTPRARDERHDAGLTPRRVLSAVQHRIPASLRPDLRQRNADLIAKARVFQPDIIWMSGDNTVITPETLAHLRRSTGARLIYACGTSPVVFSRAIDRAAARHYDLVLANDYYHGIQWLELGARRMVCLPLSACDPDFHRPYPLTEPERAALACDITFVGTLIPANLYSRRVQALEALSGFDMGIWSVHDVPESLRRFVRGAALGEAMERIVSAGKITVNTHGDFVFYGGNLRLFEAAGAGAFQIADDLPGVREWFPNVDGIPTIVTYTDLANLTTKVEHYLRHDDEREAIARAARQHVYSRHTYDRRVERVESLIAELG